MKNIVSFFLFSFALTFGAFALTDNAALNAIATNTGSSPTGSATAANQTAVQANPGSDATKATAVQGVTGGKAVPVSAASLPLPSGAASESTVSNLNSSIGNGFGATAAAYYDNSETTLNSINNNFPSGFGNNANNYFDSAGAALNSISDSCGSTLGTDTSQISQSVQSIDSKIINLDIGFGAASNGTTRVALASDQAPIAVTTGASPISVTPDHGSIWNYAAASGGISNSTTAVTIKIASGVNIVNYINSIQISADALGAATEVVIRKGASGTVIWRGKISTAGLAPVAVVLASPLASDPNQLLEVATLTATITGGVYVNAQGTFY